MWFPLNLLFSSLVYTVPTAAPLDPSPALLLFFGHAPARQCPSCCEGPKTEHSIWGVVSPVLSTGGRSLPYSCWPHYFQPQTERIGHVKILQLPHFFFSVRRFFWTTKLHAFALSVDGTIIICNPSESKIWAAKMTLNKYRNKTIKLSKSELFAFIFKLINSFVN